MAGNRTPEQESPRNNNLQRPDMEPQLPAQGPLQPRMIEEEEQQPGEERMQLRQDSRKLSPQQQLSQQLQQHIPDTPQYRIIQKLRSRVPDTPQQKIIQKLQSGIRDTPGQDSPQQQDAASSKGDGPAGAPSTAPPPKQNSGGGQDLPQPLQSGMERLSGLSLTDIRVHYDSEQPGLFGAHSFAQGRDIHLGPGRGDDLPHEAWHTVQQKQGRVPITRQFRDTGINDDPGLEREADVMGEKALQMKVSNDVQPLAEEPLSKAADSGPLQKKDAGTESATDTATDSGGFTEGLIIQSGSLRLYSSLGQLNKGLADRSYYGGILVDMPPGTKLLVYNSTINDAKKRVKAYVNGKEYDGFCSGHPSEVRLLSSPEEKKKQEAETEERIKKLEKGSKKSGSKGLDFDSSKEDYIDFVKGLSGFGIDGLATTGSMRLDVELTFAALGKVLWGGGRAEIGGKLAIGAGINVQDDRRLRVSGGVKITGFGKGSVLWKLIDAGVDLSLEFSLTGVYESPEHFAVYMRAKVLEFLASLSTTIEKKGFDAPSKIASAVENLNEANTEANNYGEILTVIEGKGTAEAHISSSVAGGDIEITGSASRSTTLPVSPSKGRGKTGRNIEYAVGVSIDVEGIGGVNIDLVYNDIKDNPNPDNNGRYLNVKAFVYGNTEVSYEEFSLLIDGIGLGSFGVLNMDTLEAIANKLAMGLQRKIKSQPKIPAKYDLWGKRKKGLVLELNYVNSDDNKDYELQYFRSTFKNTTKYGSSTDLTSGGGLGGAGVSAGVSIKSVLEAGVFEVMGSDTLSYASTVYNGLMNRKSGDRSDWDTYSAVHFAGLRNIALQLGNPKSNARAEYNSKGLNADAYIALCEKAFNMTHFSLDSLHDGLEVQLVKGLERYILIPLRKQTQKDANALYQ